MWERHQWAPSDVPGVGDTPWKAFDSRVGVRAAATRQTSLLVKLSNRPEIFLLDPIKHWVTTMSALTRITPAGMAAVSVIPDEVASVLEAIPAGADIN
jgi:hypothetical protein